MAQRQPVNGTPVNETSPRAVPLSDEDGNSIFSFECNISTDLSSPLPIRGEEAILQGAIRHSHETAIDILPGVPGEINLGIRLFAATGGRLVYEARAFTVPQTLQPMLWLQVSIKIPRRAVEVGTTYLINIDFVREHRYWFSQKAAHDYRYTLAFEAPPLEEAGSGRIDRELADLRTVLQNYMSEVDSNFQELTPILAEIKAFRTQIPRFLNAISTANAAASIVGKAKAALDADNGSVEKVHRDFAYQIQSLWEAYDVIAKRLDLSLENGKKLLQTRRSQPGPRLKNDGQPAIFNSD